MDWERLGEMSRGASWQDVFPPDGLLLAGTAGTVDTSTPAEVLLLLSAKPTGLALLTPGLKL